VKSAGGYVFLNGRFVRGERAAVSVYDRGLLFGDGLFETMRSYRGIVFALEDHLLRLRQSADLLGIPVPDYDWRAKIDELLRRNRLGRTDARVRLTVTRGPAPLLIVPPKRPRPTTILMAAAVEAELARSQRAGVSVRLLPYSRHGFIPEHKSLNYLPAVVGKTLATSYGAHEGIFVRQDGVLTEGTTSSLFIVRNGYLCTPPIPGILPGITREKVLELASRAGIPTRQSELRADDLRSCDEAFLTSSVGEIMPVVEVDGAGIGFGRPGPMTRSVQRLYRGEVERALRHAREDGARPARGTGRRAKR
jgi:branched-chain amino acid aminotransferase